MKLSTKQLCDRLDISRERVEQWLSRGFLKTSHNPKPGQTREWAIDDAIRLQATIDLMGASLPASMAAHHAKFAAWGELQSNEFLVVTFRADGATAGHLVLGDELATIIGSASSVIVINLDVLRARVAAVFHNVSEG